MTIYCASELKGELRAATDSLCDRLEEDGAVGKLAAVFYIFDGGNGQFYLYADWAQNPRTLDWQAVIEQPSAIQGQFAQVLKRHDEIRHGAVTARDLQTDNLGRMEDGSMRRIGWGDADLNKFLSQLAVEVLADKTLQSRFRRLSHPMGCIALLSDDEVMGHKEYVTCKLA